MNIQELINHPNNTQIQETVGDILSLAICESFKNKPEDSIDYIANQLLNHNEQLVQKEQLKKANEQFEETKAVKKRQDELLKDQAEAIQKNNESILSKREKFFDSIENNENLQESLTNMCNHLKEFTDATGVYVVSQTLKSRVAKETDKIEETLTTDLKTIKFQATNEDHKFLLKKEHDINTLTGSLFEKKATEEQGDDAGEEGEAKAVKKLIYYDEKNDELGETLTEEQKKSMEEIFIPEVIANDKIRYWGVPKLGSMYALKFTLKTYLIDTAINDAIADYKFVNERKMKMEEEKRNYELQLREWEENQNQGDMPEKPQFEEIKEKPKTFHTKHFAVVLDTLGQDRMFTKKQRIYVQNIVKKLKNNTEELEKRQLDDIVHLVVEQDINMSKEFENDQKLGKDKWMDRIDVPQSEEGRETFLKFEAYREAFLDVRNFDIFIKCLTNFRTMKFCNIALCSLYFFKGVSKADVMVIDPIQGVTNTVDWLKARKYFDKELRNVIQKQSPRGQKTEDYPSQRKLDQIQNELAGVDQAIVNEFFQGLNLIRELILIAIECRKVDRDQRLKKREENLQAIQKIVEEKEEFDRRKKEEEDAGNAWTEGEFGQVIPPEPPLEIDNDIE